MTIELIQLKQTPSQDGTHLNIDLLFEVGGSCYWRHIEMDHTPTLLADGSAVAPWKELLYIVNKQLKSVEKEHFLSSPAETRKFSLDPIHPDLEVTISRLEELVKA